MIYRGQGEGKDSVGDCLYMFVETHHAAPLKLMNISVYKVYFSKLIKEKKKTTEEVNSPFDLKKDCDTTHGN